MLKHLRSLTLLFIPGIALSINVSAQLFQSQPNPAKNWQNESIEQDSVYGTGSDKALELLKGKPSTTVIVAVIDGGVYIKHPALQGHIWVNPKEIPGNKIDDDHNGYVDDVNGWDFIGGKDSDVNQDNLEVTRLYRDLNKEFASANPAQISKAEKPQYTEYLKVKKGYEKEKGDYQQKYDNLKEFSDNIEKIKSALGKSDLTKEDLDSYTPSDSSLSETKKRLTRYFDRLKDVAKGITADSIEKQIQPGLKYYDDFLTYQYNTDFDPRKTVNDHYTDASERYYGNNDVAGPTAEHGTHVSGIIAGERNGKPGDHEGITDNVKIMAVRVVPDGDERDKDVANGIRYAVANGAKVINMSFGKGFAYNKKTVDEAVKYAEAHDVLLIHAAGNDHQNNDSTDNFPNRRYQGSHKQAKNWIEVGASDSKGKPGSFSNYGKKTVDLFAPGVKIYSSIPDSDYAYFNGTSMASPCVAGVATIIREYFPTLTAKQVKKILMESVTKVNFKVPMPGHRDKMVEYKDLCISGGIVNAYKAVQLAMKKTGMK